MNIYAGMVFDTKNTESTKIVMQDRELIIKQVLTISIDIHQHLGPELLESVYEVVWAQELERIGFHVERQKPIPIKYNNIKFDEGFRADLWINNTLLIELKAVEQLAPIHIRQVITYLKLLNQPLGLLINFGEKTLKDGIRRIVI